MKVLEEVILDMYGLFIIVCIILLVFLIFKKVKAKKLEDFEKRDN